MKRILATILAFVSAPFVLWGVVAAAGHPQYSGTFIPSL